MLLEKYYFGVKFRNWDFDWFIHFEVAWIRKLHFLPLVSLCLYASVISIIQKQTLAESPDLVLQIHTIRRCNLKTFPFCLFYSSLWTNKDPINAFPTNSGAVLLSKLVDLKCRVQSLPSRHSQSQRTSFPKIADVIAKGRARALPWR